MRKIKSVRNVRFSCVIVRMEEMKKLLFLPNGGQAYSLAAICIRGNATQVDADKEISNEKILRTE